MPARCKIENAYHIIAQEFDVVKAIIKDLALFTDVRTEMNSGPWCVYVLRCRNNSLYIGMTNDLEKRIKKHNLGTGSKFVRSWRPFELVKTIPCRNEGEARGLEYDLKKLTRKKKIEVLELPPD
jgi:putative endonuclease